MAKTNHKKKMKEAVEKVKRKHKREIIKNDIYQLKELFESSIYNM